MIHEAHFELSNENVDGIVSVVGALLTLGGTVLGYLIKRRDKSEPPLTKDDADKAFVDQAARVAQDASPAVRRDFDQLLLGQAMNFAQEFNERAAAAEAQAREANERAAQLEKRFASLERTIQEHVAPIVDWIDSGAEPPAPNIADELRAMLARIEQ